MKSIANYLTISRLFIALTLLVVKPLSLLFFIIYIICGICDMLDGYIARKTDTASKLGEKLDSIADLTMVIVVLYKLYPVIQLPFLAYYWIALIVIIRMSSLIVVYIKHRTFGILHTYANKGTGLLLFLTPLFLMLLTVNITTYILCLAGCLSALEELIIHIKSQDLELNRKSILHSMKDWW